jgi:hypothetical protein
MKQLKLIKQILLVILLAVTVIPTAFAQSPQPKGLYKLTEIIHQDGKHVEAPFKQYKLCFEDLSLMINYSQPIFKGNQVNFFFSNPDGKPLRYTGELSKTENKGIQIFGTSDSTFTLRWFNDRGAFNEHLFPSQTNIDEIYIQVTDSTDIIQYALNLLQQKLDAHTHRLQGTWKCRGSQKNNCATSQYWIEKTEKENYMVFGSNGAVGINANSRFPKGNMNCTYIPCKYLSENAIELGEQTCILNWFDQETISMTAINRNGLPEVSIWDRCGLPRNIQKVFKTDTPLMEKDNSRYFSDDFYKRYGTQPDSICQAYETFSYAIEANEKNNAIFPVLMDCGFKDEYSAMKDSLMARMMRGEISVDEAVSRYVFWFNKNFDRHTNCSSPFFWKLHNENSINYQKLIPKYAPEPVGCKIDDDTYLLRLPSCMGDVPTWEWMKKKAEEFKQAGCQYLILDLRGNSGGSDHFSLLFTSMMCDRSAIHDQQHFYLVSTENNKQLKKRSESIVGSFIERVFNEAQTAKEGSLINWMTIHKGELDHTPLVRKGAIIIDNYSASAAESPVRYVHNFSKGRAKVYGRDNTNGCEQTGNCNYIQLPHSNISLCYPMTVDDTFKQFCKQRNPGYKPDVIIPLPYPEQLTDNIDPWVLWVAKKMKK